MLRAQLFERVFNTPLLIEEGKAGAIMHALQGRFGFDLEGGFQPVAAASLSEKKDSKKPMMILDGIAIIPVIGTLVHRGGMMAESGMTAYQALAQHLDDAHRSGGVRGILMEIDSPGGEVSGLDQTAAMVREIAQDKPVWAYVNERAYSAAYWLASAADKIYLSRTAGVGSIGVLAQHVDVSKANEKQGLKVTSVYAGRLKTDLDPNKPLSKDALGRLQARVDQLYDLFVAEVAQNRGLSESAVYETEAGLFYGEEAVSAGLADGVLTTDFILSEFIGEITGANSLQASFESGGTMLFGRKHKEGDSAKAEVATAEKDKDKDRAEDDEDEGDYGEAEAEAPEADAADESGKDEKESGSDEAESQDGEDDAPSETDRAAAITDAACAAGFPHMASELIRSRTTVADAEKEIADAVKIKEVCEMAGHGDMADGFIAQRKPLVDVQASLIQRMAKSDEESEVCTIAKPDVMEAQAERAKSQNNPLMRDIERRIAEQQARQGNKV